jgi:hypothetical protein
LIEQGFNRWKPIAWDNAAMSFGMTVFGAGGGSDESSGDEEETGSQGSAVDIEDFGRCEQWRTLLCSMIFSAFFEFLSDCMVVCAA